MAHLDEERLQRLLHRELPAGEESAAREHVASCADCRRSLSEAEQEEAEVHALLHAVDVSPPSVRVEAVALRAELDSVAERARDSAWLRRAAAVLVLVGIAGAAYAVPGSPVRRWVHAIVEKIGGRPGPAGVKSGDSAVGAGISVLPEEKLLILFRLAQDGGQVFVSLTEGPEVQVHAPTAAATFTSGSGRLLIDVRDPSAAFEVRIPRSTPWVEIRVGEDRVFLKEGSRVTTSGSTSPGGYLLRLPRSEQ